MAERAQWQSVQEEQERQQFFVLASELEPGPEGRKQRLEEKVKMLLSAGVVFPGEGSWEEQGGISLMPRQCPRPPYPGGTSSTGGISGGMGGAMSGGMGGRMGWGWW